MRLVFLRVLSTKSKGKFKRFIQKEKEKGIKRKVIEQQKEKERRENAWPAIREHTILMESPGNPPEEGQNPTEGSGCSESPYCPDCALGPTCQNTIAYKEMRDFWRRGTDSGWARVSSRGPQKGWMGKKSKTFHYNYFQKENCNGYPFICVLNLEKFICVLNLEKTSTTTTDSCSWQGFK